MTLLDHYGEPLTWPPTRLGFSRLKQIGRSPAHYRAACMEPFAPTDAMRFGTLVHALVLGGEFVVWEHENGRRGAGWKAFAAEHAGKHVVTRAELDRAMPIMRAVHEDPVVRETGCLVGDRELQVDWAAFGSECRGRVDVLDRKRRYVTDLKVCREAHPIRFQWQARRLGYHAQGEWYARGTESAYGLPDGHVEHVYLVAVESAPPHLVTVHRLTDALRDEASRQLHGWLETLRTCEASDEWPGYAQYVVPFDVLEDDAGLVWGDDDATGEVAA